jgi:outer membrane protein OmpA-like peptidoglycan-associated protein
MFNFIRFFYKYRSGKRSVNFLLLSLFLFFAGNIYAAESEQFYKGISAGAGMDLNGYSRDGVSLGGLISVDYRFLPILAAGFKSGFGYDFTAITHAEAEIFTRFYFLSYTKPLNGLMIFSQLEGGAAGIWENNSSGGKENIWTFSGALTTGLRLGLPSNFYAECYVRGGYPFIWSASIVLGHTFTGKQSSPKAGPVKPEAEPEVKPESESKAEPENPVQPSKPVEPLVREAEQPVVDSASVPSPAPVVKYPVISGGDDVAADFQDIIFRDNGADFTDLDGAIVALNNEILDRISEFLKRNPEYKLRIEGYANPVQTTPRAKAVEEERFLLPISKERANTILELLAARGVNRSRLTAVGLGGKKTVVDVTDKDNWQKNRRVEFVLLK